LITPEKEGFPSGEIKDEDLYLERITRYVQHPVPLKNEKLENLNKMITPVYLTAKEKKKLSRNKRLEKEKDK
jgi:U4/U6 small nuclear ribonucleoprotein PRP3